MTPLPAGSDQACFNGPLFQSLATCYLFPRVARGEDYCLLSVSKRPQSLILQGPANVNEEIPVRKFWRVLGAQGFQRSAGPGCEC